MKIHLLSDNQQKTNVIIHLVLMWLQIEHVWIRDCRSDSVRHMMASPALLEIVNYIFHHFQILYKVKIHLLR